MAHDAYANTPKHQVWEFGLIVSAGNAQTRWPVRGPILAQRFFDA
jgi:hypothetical protein